MVEDEVRARLVLAHLARKARGNGRGEDDRARGGRAAAAAATSGPRGRVCKPLQHCGEGMNAADARRNIIGPGIFMDETRLK